MSDPISQSEAEDLQIERDTLREQRDRLLKAIQEACHALTLIHPDEPKSPADRRDKAAKILSEAWAESTEESGSGTISEGGE